MKLAPLLGTIVLFSSATRGAEFPKFESDLIADRWLRETSTFYRTMAAAVDERGGYQFRAWNGQFLGNVVVENGQRFIELKQELVGAERVSVLIFELTNAFQAAKHEEVDAKVRTGELSTAREFGLWHEAVEYDGLRLHRTVLEELDRAVGGIPTMMLRWINPALKTLAEYQLPFAFDYFKAQEASGHTRHYHEWFPIQAAASQTQPRPASPAAKAVSTLPPDPVLRPRRNSEP